MNETQRNSLFENKTALLIDVKRMAERCLEQDNLLQDCRQTIDHQNQSIAELKAEQTRAQNVIDLGRRELNRKKADTLSRLRAIAHYTGDEHRLEATRQTLERDDVSPAEVDRLHDSVSAEFQSLYPNYAISNSDEIQNQSGAQRINWSAFQLG